MEEEDFERRGDGNQRLLAPILEQLAVLQNAVANLAGQRKLPTPEEVARKVSVPDVQEAALVRKGNRNQFNFCRSIGGLADSALECFQENGQLKTTVGADQAVHALLISLKEQVAKRSKLIKLADRSEAGWAVVEHYEADPIAQDSGDEKRIRSAEKIAVATKKTVFASKVKKSRTGLYGYLLINKAILCVGSVL